jgi:Uma2 family endonuclease
VEDDKPVESTKHSEQADLLVQLAKSVTGDRPDNCIATDLAIYYHPDESPVVPDLMVVLGVEPKEDRGSYTTWEEGKGPVVVVELLSRSNRDKDRTTNYEIYEQRLQVPEYFWFDPLDPSELRGFRLREGRYEDITPNEQGRLWSDELKVWLGVHERWLRLYDSAGQLILTGKEEAVQDRAAREQEQAAREAAETLAQQERATREQEQAARAAAEARVQHERTAREQEQAARAEAEARAQHERTAREQEQAAREAAEASAQQERAAREAAEAEVARLREELARLKADEIRNSQA